MDQPAQRATLLPWGLGLFAVLLHLPFLCGYGYHGDELYFLSCGARPDLGYVDHAPLVPWLAAAVDGVFPDSLFALRLLACLAGGATVSLTAVLCRELGGGRFAMLLAGTALMLGPFFLRTANMFAIPSFEPLWWTLMALLLLRLAARPRPGLWLAFGLVAGIALMTKHTALLWGFAIAAALLLTSQRRQLLTPWPWLAAGLALLLFLPNLLWQQANGWPTWDFATNLNRAVMAGISRTDFLLGQALYAGVGNLVLWVPGLLLLLRRGGPGRLLGIAFGVVLAALLVVQSKIYYSMPAYPAMFAAGALFWERATRGRARGGLAAIVLASGLALAPISVPVLPIDAVDRYAAKVTFGLAGRVHEITGDLRYMFGWPEIATGVTAAWAGLGAEERARTFVFAGSYAVAGALERFVPAAERPRIVCNHMSWHLWSRQLLEHGGDATVDGVVTYGFGDDALRRWFDEVERIAVIAGDPRAGEDRRDRPVFLCRRPRRPLSALWPARPWL